VHTEYWNGNSWQQATLPGPANVAGNITVDSTSHYVYYTDTNGQMWTNYWTGSMWANGQLSSTGNVGGPLVVDSGPLLYYRFTADNSLWAQYWTGSMWAQGQMDLGAVLGSNGSSATLFAHQVLLDLDNNGQCKTESWSGSQWVHALLGDGGISANQVGTLS
jgi:hypothetical protein